MVCVTDDERRAAASLLRSFADGGMWGEFIDYCSSAGPSRLADLIEPSCDASATVTDASATRDVSQMRRSDVDRDALLALAGCVGKMGEDYDKIGAFGLSITFGAIADRIREACGATEDD